MNIEELRLLRCELADMLINCNLKVWERHFLLESIEAVSDKLREQSNNMKSLQKAYEATSSLLN